MDGQTTFEAAVRKSMCFNENQALVKGIGSGDVHSFLCDLVDKYKLLGRNVYYKWKKLGKSRNENNPGFNGGSIGKLLAMVEKRCIVIIGASKRTGQAQEKIIKKLNSEDDQKRMETYSTAATGKSRADHAIGVQTGNNPLMFDDGFTRISKEFNIMNLARSLRDVNNAYVIDIGEL